MRKDLRKERMLDYIEGYTAENCCPPTIRDIQDELKIKSTSTIYGDLTELFEENKLNRIKGRSNRFAPKYTESFKEKLLTRFGN